MYLSNKSSGGTWETCGLVALRASHPERLVYNPGCQMTFSVSKTGSGSGITILSVHSYILDYTTQSGRVMVRTVSSLLRSYPLKSFPSWNFNKLSFHYKLTLTYCMHLIGAKIKGGYKTFFQSMVSQSICIVTYRIAVRAL